MAAIFAGAHREAFGIGVRLARVRRRPREWVIAKALAGDLHGGAGHALAQRLVGIFVLARTFENIAAFHDLATQIAGLAGDAAELLETIVGRLELVVTDGKVRDRHLLRDRVLAVALREVAAQRMIGGQQPPGQPVPVRAGAAEPGSGQERAEPPYRQCSLIGRMAQRHRLHGRVLEQLLAHGIFEIVAHRRQREVLARHAPGATLEPHHLEARLGELACQDRAGPADADHHRIGFLEHRGHCRCLPFSFVFSFSRVSAL